MQKEFEELKQQYGVTVKVVKAQGEYINDLETKNLALAKHIKESKYKYLRQGKVGTSTSTLEKTIKINSDLYFDCRF